MIKKRVTGIVFFIISISTLLSFHALSELMAENKADGLVITVRDGKLERWFSNDWEELRKGNQVFFGDRIRTDKNALAIIELTSIGRFVMGPEAEMELGKDKKEFRANLNRGSLWLNSRLPKDTKAYITTSLATAGIRGTKFSILYDKKSMDVCTCLGEVEVLTPEGKLLEAQTGSFVPVRSGFPLPENARSSSLILKRVGEGKDRKYDFCFNCHIEGGKGELKRGWE